MSCGNCGSCPGGNCGRAAQAVKFGLNLASNIVAAAGGPAAVSAGLSSAAGMLDGFQSQFGANNEQDSFESAALVLYNFSSGNKKKA